MHQHSNILNFNPRLRLTLQSRVTSKVLVSVTIGMGDFVHNSKAMALLVSLGLISCFIVLLVFDCKDGASRVQWSLFQLPRRRPFSRFSTTRTVQAECNRARSYSLTEVRVWRCNAEAPPVLAVFNRKVTHNFRDRQTFGIFCIKM